MDMVNFKEFIQSEHESAPSNVTSTDLGLYHDGDYVTLYCPDKYGSVTFSVLNSYKYYDTPWAWQIGVSKGPEISASTAEGWDYANKSLPRTKTEELVLKTGESKTYTVSEGQKKGNINYFIVDHNLYVTLKTTTDTAGTASDVTPDPLGPSTLDNWAKELQTWFNTNQWTIVGFLALSGLLVVTYLVLRTKVVSAQPVTVVEVPK